MNTGEYRILPGSVTLIMWLNIFQAKISKYMPCTLPDPLINVVLVRPGHVNLARPCHLTLTNPCQFGLGQSRYRPQSQIHSLYHAQARKIWPWSDLAMWLWASLGQSSPQYRPATSLCIPVVEVPTTRTQSPIQTSF